MRRRELAVRALLSRFRGIVGSTPDDAPLAGLVAELAAHSAELRTWWSSGRPPTTTCAGCARCPISRPDRASRR
ncbi:MmyB family transcriptional regulator [Nocardia sp. MW-W600-9]